MRTLIELDSEARSIQVIATGDEVEPMCEQIFSQWEKDDPGYKRPEGGFTVVGRKPEYFESHTTTYMILEV